MKTKLSSALRCLMRPNRVCLFIILFFFTVVSGCVEPPVEVPQPEPTPTPESVVILRLHGSSTLGSRLAPDLAEAFLKNKGADNVVKLTESEANKTLVQGVISGEPAPQVIEIIAQDSGMAFTNLAAGTCDIGLSSRRIEQEEIQNLSSLGDMTSRKSENVVALDAIAIIVHRDNPVDTLSIDQIMSIFSGDIRDWSEVDGDAGPMTVYALDDNSGTYEAFQQTVLVDKQLIAGAERIASDVVLSGKVSADEASIGFVKLAYARDAKTVAVTDGESVPMSPDKFSIGTEDYLLSHRLYLYVPEKSDNTNAREFIDFALSQEGQEIVALNDFVDLNIKLRSITLIPDSSAKDLIAEADTQKMSSEAREYLKIKKGADKLSSNIRFRYNSSELDNKAQRDIARIVEFLERDPEYKERGIALLGFADNKGSQRYNIDLTQKRAQSVAQQLSDRGIESSIVVGLGEENPVATNETEEGQSKNRRVEIWLLNPEKESSIETEITQADFDPEWNSGRNRVAKGATVIPVKGSDPKGYIAYDKGDKTDWYRVNISTKGTFTYQIEQKTANSTLFIELYYSPKGPQAIERNPLEKSSLKGKDEYVFLVEDAKPGAYFAKVSVENPGDASSYKISNTFITSSDGVLPDVTQTESREPEATPTPPSPAIDDIEPPTIIISSPAQDSITADEAILITGYVEDTSEIALLKINEQTIPLAGGKGFIAEKDRFSKEFSYQVTSLQPGENAIDIAAWDNAGNIETTTLRITREVEISEPTEPPAATPTPEATPQELDTQLPVVIILSPDPDSVITADSVTVTGRVDDESSIPQIMINGKPVSLGATRGFIVDQQQPAQEFTYELKT